MDLPVSLISTRLETSKYPADASALSERPYGLTETVLTKDASKS